MINDILIHIVTWFDTIFSNLDLYSALNNILTVITKYKDYAYDIQYYLSGAYFIFGKSMVLFVLGASAIVFTIKLIGAIVMIVSQFIP